MQPQYMGCDVALLENFTKIKSPSAVSGGSRNFERGVQRGQLTRRGFTTPINLGMRLLTSVHALLLADVESEYSLTHFVVR